MLLARHIEDLKGSSGRATVVLAVGCLAAVVLAIGGCRGGKIAPIEAVPMLPIGDNRNWIVTQPMSYRVGSTSDSVLVPTGFVTDYASIPSGLQSVIQVLDLHLRPAIVHDYLYWTQACSRGQADSLLYIAMLEHHVAPREALRIWEGVRSPFGKQAWDSNRGERNQGLSRIVPVGFRRPRAMENWREYRESIAAQLGPPHEPAVEITPGFCAQGGPSRP